MAYSTCTTGKPAMVLYDVTTLHFENKDEDDLRKVGRSKEHRVDPQVQVGLLVDPGRFPLEVHPFGGKKAKTTTLIPVLTSFHKRHGVTDMVVVADAGMLSAVNLNALEDAGRHRRRHKKFIRSLRPLRTVTDQDRQTVDYRSS